MLLLVMVKQMKYIVKIPSGDGAVVEKQFETTKDIADFLGITENTLYTFRSGRMKMKHKSKKVLEGITVEKIDVVYRGKVGYDDAKNKVSEKDKVEFHQSLVKKIQA